jgi:hypothetical protein
MLPQDVPAAYRDLRILSSLLIPCGIVLREARPDWESLRELLSYAVYSQVPHAPIEPFHFVISNHASCKKIDFNSIYFDDPSRFLHIDKHGHVALSRKELDRGDHVLNDLERLGEIQNCPSYVYRLNAWRELFLKPNGCAYCPGWRFCLGKYEAFADNECQEFFNEWLEAAEYYQRKQAKPDDVRNHGDECRQ